MHINNHLKLTFALVPPILGAAVLIGAALASAAPPPNVRASAQANRVPTLVCSPPAPHARPLGIACEVKGGVGALPKGARTLLLKLPRKYTALQLLCHKNARLGISCTLKHATTVAATGTRTVKVALPAKWQTVTISCRTTNPRLGIACLARK
jgi:hypothetical protein